MPLAKISTFFEEFIDNRLNPILVRELRQMVRSRFIVVMLNLYIGLLVFVCLSTVAFSTFLREEGAGRNLFGILSSIMGFSSFVVVVLYTGIVTSSERINSDLMYSSAIKPWQIVFGKFGSGLILSLLLFSAVFPFFTLAYLLRGLDLYTFLITIYLIFLGIHTFNSVVIFISSAIRTSVQMIFVGFLAFMLFFPMFSGIWGLMGLIFGFGGYMGGAPTVGVMPWNALITMTLFSLSIIGFFLVGGVVIVSPPSSNRMLPMRLFLSIWFLLSLAFVLYFRYFSSTYVPSNFFEVWCVLHLVMLTAFIPFITCERDEWNYRIRRSIPYISAFRLFVFPFYTGAACGLVWWLGYLGAIAVAFCLFGDVSKISINGEFLNIGSVILFVFVYFYTALIIRTQYVSKWVTPGKTWAIALALCAFASIGSAFLYFLITFQNTSLAFMEHYDESVLSIFNPFQLIFRLNAYSYTSEILPQSYGALVWGAALVPYLVYWLFIRLARFSPEPTEDMITYERVIAAQETTDTPVSSEEGMPAQGKDVVYGD